MNDMENTVYYDKMLKIHPNIDGFSNMVASIERKTFHEPNTGCWLYVGDSVVGGYGRVVYRGKKYLAHRVSYVANKGEIPYGKTIDHLCGQTCCVNPQHLEAVNHRVNNLRSASPPSKNAAKTHCLRGHEYTEENTHRHKDGRRECRTCIKTRATRRSKKK
jgi:hypothetical protein